MSLTKGNNPPTDASEAIPYGVATVSALYMPEPGQPAIAEQYRVVEEDALFIDIENVGSYTLMWTPTDYPAGGAGYTAADGILAEIEGHPAALALAIGFCHSEGIIDSIDDIDTMLVCPDEPNVVKIQLKAADKVQTRRRDVIVTSSCGICGKREILEDNAFNLAAVPNTLQVDYADIARLMTAMSERQKIFRATGGAHAAAIFSADGKILHVAEDLGRHNALDKVIGHTMLEQGDTRGCGAILSSRLSMEMVVKAIRAGLEVVCAVSAPTSLAIDLAQRFGITLCGFVRGERATIYAHPERVRGVRK